MHKVGHNNLQVRFHDTEGGISSGFKIKIFSISPSQLPRSTTLIDLERVVMNSIKNSNDV